MATSPSSVVKTALNVDRNLVAEASRVLGTVGTTDTIDAALRKVVERAARERLLERVRLMSGEQRAAILDSWD